MRHFNVNAHQNMFLAGTCRGDYNVLQTHTSIWMYRGRTGRNNGKREGEREGREGGNRVPSNPLCWNAGYSTEMYSPNCAFQDEVNSQWVTELVPVMSFVLTIGCFAARHLVHLNVGLIYLWCSSMKRLVCCNNYAFVICVCILAQHVIWVIV